MHELNFFVKTYLYLNEKETLENFFQLLVSLFQDGLLNQRRQKH